MEMPEIYNSIRTRNCSFIGLNGAGKKDDGNYEKENAVNQKSWKECVLYDISIFDTKAFKKDFSFPGPDFD